MEPKAKCPLPAVSSEPGIVKFHALKGGASQQGSFVYIVPLDPGLKAGDCGARSVQLVINKRNMLSSARPIEARISKLPKSSSVRVEDTLE